MTLDVNLQANLDASKMPVRIFFSETFVHSGAYLNVASGSNEKQEITG